jgi:polyribonucleotide nucleotidyltransferase
MGLIKEGDQFAVLSDIIGDEDHLGDMDFKVAGTAKGITAIQMDIKIVGVNHDIMLTALEQAREGRLYILDKMNEVLSVHRSELSPFAPRIYVMMVKPDKIREFIGPGGKIIRGIQEQTGVKIDVDDDGTVKIAAIDADSARAAISIIEGIAQVPEIGKVYHGRVRKIMDFGVFVEIFPGTDGLLHVSQISRHRVNAAECFKEGDDVTVRVLEVDREGKIRLSHKEFEEEGRFKPATTPAPSAEKDKDSGKEKERDRGRGPRNRR